MLSLLAVRLETLRARLWVIPAIGALLAAAGALVLVTVDRSLASDGSGPLVFGGGPDSARAILSTIAAAMLSFTGLVFSVTMLVLQLASSQISPRVTRTYLRDRKNQAVLATFVATFTYALLVLREVRSEPDPFVPELAVGAAFALLLASIGAFIFYIDHMAQAMRVETVVAGVADETREAIRRCHPDPFAGVSDVDAPLLPVSALVTSPDRPGIVQHVDVERLVAIAREAGVVLDIVPGIGDAVPAQAALVRVRGAGPVDHDAVRAAVGFGGERTMEEDPGFGFRQLVDIATRALSPGINDPTTAVTVVARLHDLLRSIAGRLIPGPRWNDDGGSLRVVLPVRDWPDYLDLACREIREYGAGSSQVMVALRRMLDDLESVAPEPRRAAVRRERARLDAAGRGG